MLLVATRPRMRETPAPRGAGPASSPPGSARGAARVVGADVARPASGGATRPVALVAVAHGALAALGAVAAADRRAARLRRERLRRAAVGGERAEQRIDRRGGGAHAGAVDAVDQ